MNPATATDREILDFVAAFDDSPDGPIRFPGSIAESNQGPDPRYRSWMDRCIPLAAVHYEQTEDSHDEG